MLGSDNRQIAAEAYVVRGDLNLAIATLPPIPAAATQPSLQIEGTTADHLSKAGGLREGLARLSRRKPARLPMPVSGLPRSQRTAATSMAPPSSINEIKNDEKTLPAYKTLADLRLAGLDDIRKPAYLVPATMPATAPSTTAPATAPQK